MASYDPQRNRARSRPTGGDEPAPVDVLLGVPAPATTPVDSPRIVADDAPTLTDTQTHAHGPDCDHDHDHGTQLDARVLVAAAAAVVAVVAVLVRRRRGTH